MLEEVMDAWGKLRHQVNFTAKLLAASSLFFTLPYYRNKKLLMMIKLISVYEV